MKKKFKFLLKLLRLAVVPFLICFGLELVIMIAVILLYYQSFMSAILLLKLQGKIDNFDTVLQLLPETIPVSFLGILTLILPVLTGIYFFFWYRGIVKKEKAPETKIKLFTVKNVILIALAGLGLQLATTGLMELILPNFPGISEEYEEMMEQFFSGNPVLVFISVVIVAPLSEELTFRGVIFKRAGRITPFVAANIIQALIFGIAHMNIVQGIYAFGGGLVMGYVAYKYQSIKASILLHLIFNGLSYLIMVPSNRIMPLLYVAVGGILIIMSILLIRKTVKTVEPCPVNADTLIEV